MAALDIIRILGVAVFFVVPILLLVRQSRLETLFSQVLGTSAHLRMRVFEQELRQLRQPGIYIPDDSAMMLSHLVISLLSEKQKKLLEETYKKRCPATTPMWKWLLHSYSFGIELQARNQGEPGVTPDEIQVADLLSGIDSLDRSMKAQMAAVEQALASIGSKIKEVEGQVESAAETAPSDDHTQSGDSASQAPSESEPK